MTERYCVAYSFAGFQRLKSWLIPTAYRLIRRRMRKQMAAGISAAYPSHRIVRKEIRWDDFGARNGGGNSPPERAPKTLKSALFAFERPVLTICYWIKPN